MQKILIFTLTLIYAGGFAFGAKKLPKPSASLHDVKITTIDGEKSTIGDYKGKVLLVVNVASQCGLTKQYKQLEAVHREYKGKGFTVLGFPCNDFGGQEPGGNEEIKKFCKSRFDVTFPMFDKVVVKKGPKQHELYSRLTGEKGAFPGNVEWNFGKFLIGRDGTPLKRFKPGQKPDSPEVIASIKKAIEQK